MVKSVVNDGDRDGNHAANLVHVCIVSTLCFVVHGEGNDTEVYVVATQTHDALHALCEEQSVTVAEAFLTALVNAYLTAGAGNGIHGKGHVLVTDDAVGQRDHVNCALNVKHVLGNVVCILGGNNDACCIHHAVANVGGNSSTQDVLVVLHLTVTVYVLLTGFSHGQHLVKCPLLVVNQSVEVFKVVVLGNVLVEHNDEGTVVVTGQQVAGCEVNLVTDGKAGQCLLVPPGLFQVDVVDLAKVVQITLGRDICTVTKLLYDRTEFTVAGLNVLLYGAHSVAYLCFKDGDVIDGLDRVVSLVNCVVDRIGGDFLSVNINGRPFGSISGQEHEFLTVVRNVRNLKQVEMIGFVLGLVAGGGLLVACRIICACNQNRAKHQRRQEQS